jgi:glycosyltransferase involved in cell wall biosynthesis
MSRNFVDQLRRPGTYRVGGLGACTLISRKALGAGISFSIMAGIEHWGEDRHFCARATTLGLELWCDTHYPVYHLYRESDLVAMLPVCKHRRRERGNRIAVAEWQEQEREPTISLCMIARNEEKNIRRCLESVKDTVSDIIVVDTGSVDDTAHIAQEYGAKVFVHPWNNDFSEARNVSLDHAIGDWVLILDADEELPPKSREILPSLLINNQVEGYLCAVTNRSEQETNQDVVFRLFRNRPEYRFTGRIHEQIIDSITSRGGQIIMSELEIIHYGYTQDNTKEKVERNLKIYEEMQLAEDDLLGHYHYGIELMRAERLDDAIIEFIAATRGVDTQQIFFPKLIRGIVISLYNLGKHDNALDIANIGIMLFPDYADLYYFAGLACYARGDYAGADRYFRKVLKCTAQPVNYSSFIGIRENAEKMVNEVIPEARGEIANLEAYNLLPLYLAAYQASVPVDIEGGGRVFKGVTVEKLRREIEWRDRV